MDLKDAQVSIVSMGGLDRMRDGRLLLVNNNQGRLEVYRSNAELDAEIPISFRANDNVSVEAISRASDRVLLVEHGKRQMSVVDIKNQVEESFFRFNEAEMPTLIVFGPNKTILMAKRNAIKIKFIRCGESYIGGEINLPHGNSVVDICSDEESCIFFSGNHVLEEPNGRSLWMMKVDGDTKKKETVKLFDFINLANYYYGRLKVVYATPSLLCVNVSSTFYIYDLVLRKVVYENGKYGLLLKHYEISLDGRTRFTFNFGRHVICATPLKMTDEMVNLVVNAKYTRNNQWSKYRAHKEEQLYMRSYTPEVHVLIILDNGLPMIEKLNNMIENRLDISTANLNRYDITFPKMLRPISTIKSPTGRWARIMSNRTLETHATWPAVGMELPASGALKHIRETFAGDPELLVAVAWFSYNSSIGPGQEEIPAREAVAMYVERLTNAVAAAVGII